ncbi:hypothetical protein H5410_007559 [Solanum commersonii]|uniref:Uncharacterized protein n=1 Tax=Solanum commersonii TaxID=4109 RepID=A0A9J6ACF3_SOLCO|nr:hypothetical protein H5410_007559 [Solanum commersonii]
MYPHVFRAQRYVSRMWNVSNTMYPVCLAAMYPTMWNVSNLMYPKCQRLCMYPVNIIFKEFLFNKVLPSSIEQQVLIVTLGFTQLKKHDLEKKKCVTKCKYIFGIEKRISYISKYYTSNFGEIKFSVEMKPPIVIQR